jgi:hypothetical protein
MLPVHEPGSSRLYKLHYYYSYKSIINIIIIIICGFVSLRSQ